MKMYVFCVKDSAMGAFGSPFFVAAPGLATRSFTDEINRAAEDNQMYKHSVDFDLYKLGEFDTETGEFECDRPELISRGVNVSTKLLEAN